MLGLKILGWGKQRHRTERFYPESSGFCQGFSEILFSNPVAILRGIIKMDAEKFSHDQTSNKKWQ